MRRLTGCIMERSGCVLILPSGNIMTGLLKAAFIFSVFFVVYSPTQGYVDSQGLVDGNHRELIKAKYKQIQYLGHGPCPEFS